MALDERIITQAIIDRYFQKLKENLSVDVAVVGGGPSGLVCSYFYPKVDLRSLSSKENFRSEVECGEEG